MHSRRRTAVRWVDDCRYPEILMSILTLQPVVADASRLAGGRADAWTLRDPLILLSCGVLAGAGTFLLEMKLKLPGHAILRCALPMAFGLALVPRKGAGSAMGATALLTGLALWLAGYGEKGLGSLTSLATLGPLLDLAASRARSGKGVIVAIIASGVGSNLLAFSAQLIAKSAGMDIGGGKRLGAWWMTAIWSYPLCGLVAGLISALLMFRWSSRPDVRP